VWTVHPRANNEKQVNFNAFIHFPQDKDATVFFLESIIYMHPLRQTITYKDPDKLDIVSVV
jgi:hypothetical protein